MVDTGAFSSAIAPCVVENIKSNFPQSVNICKNSPSSVVKVANGETVRTLGAVELTFRLGCRNFTEKFLLLPKMNRPILGLPFYEKYNMSIDVKNRKLHAPDFTFQLNEITSIDGSPRKIYSKHKFTLKTTQKIQIHPNSQEVLQRYPSNDLPDGIVGIIDPNPRFERKTGLCMTSSLSKITHNQTPLAFLNCTTNIITLPKDTTVGNFTILTPKQSQYLQPIDPAILSTISPLSLNELIHADENSPIFGESDFWFPTPETCSDPSSLTGLHRKIYQTLVSLKTAEKLDPTLDATQRQAFLNHFNWEKTILSLAEREQVEALLIEFHDIFARHRFDVGDNYHFSVKLTPEHHDPVYTQSPPTPIHLREEILHDLAVMQYFGLITTLADSKYSSPLFAHRKPSGKLRLLVGLRKINHLIRHDYDSNNFPITTMADAGTHLAGKSILAKLDCSQAYHALKMADFLSVQMLAFNFASRTFAFQRLAQGLSRSVSAFSSFMRKHLDSCIANDQCFQYVDDLGTGARSFGELLSNLRSIFQCIRTSGLKLTMNKCEFGVAEISYLGSTISSSGTSPNREKVEQVLSKVKMPKNHKQIKRMIGFFQYFRNYLPKLSDSLLPFYKVLKQNVNFEITDEHTAAFDVLSTQLANACDMSLRLPIANLQYVILSDASYYSAGYVLMIEDYTTNQQGDTVKSYAPVAFGSKIFNPTYLKLSIYAKEFLAVYFAFDTFAHILWGAQLPVLVLTDNRSLTRFFQAKTIPTPLWTAVDQVLNFSFILGHIPGKANAAADFLSRVNVDPHTKLSLKISTRMPVKHVEIDFSAESPNPDLTALTPSTTAGLAALQ